ncbi:hypothetical protein PHMEG_00016114 [Phytophthora megakarya]|uniref:Uncharacterized protein n=1 Tax=Phytophthora megakarya TaxID=4795 RepID=A0A225VZR6_9STRA|nr:hypothetical protein PHMEG_00016114 [Phytophthora megakarya]
MLSHRFRLMRPRLLEFTLRLLLEMLRDTSLSDDKKPFTWEMCVTEFPEFDDVGAHVGDRYTHVSVSMGPKVEAFLTNSDRTMTTEGILPFLRSQ